MGKIVKFLKMIFLSRIVLYIIGMVVAALLIWLIAPSLGMMRGGSLDVIIQKTIATILIPALLGLGAVFSGFRYKRINNQLQQSLAETPEHKAKTAAHESAAAEVSDLGTKLNEALTLLRKSQKAKRAWGNGWLYELPWYIFIGPPGSGKTTALTNCGLNFPLADHAGGKVKGVGGTRSCDWWFTDQAVLIDTAGRFTTQDSDALADAGSWTGFLRLLKKFRKRQPINGVIIAVGIPDLLAATDDKRAEFAKNIRARLKELDTELGVPFTVYMLFTKVDRIAGFVDFFDRMLPEEFEQVWGMTFDAATSGSTEAALASYGDEFDALIGRLNDRVLERMQQETDSQRRAAIFGFPQQMASLKQLTDGFMRAVFQPNRYEKPARLRGAYFTSGTQEGTPIDRVMNAMSATFGIQAPQKAAAPNSGRSYFLTRLMRELIFAEAGLVSADSKYEKRNKLIRYCVLGGAAGAVALMTAAWVFTWFSTSALAHKINGNAQTYSEHTQKISLDAVNDADARKILPLLDDLKSLPGDPATDHSCAHHLVDLSRLSGNRLCADVSDAYQRGLGSILLPRVIFAAHEQLVRQVGEPRLGDADKEITRQLAIYATLKRYLLLSNPGKLDGLDQPNSTFVEQAITNDWARAYPEPETAGDRKALDGHLRTMLANYKSLPTYPRDDALVTRARAALAGLKPARIAYDEIMNYDFEPKLPDWSVIDVAGDHATDGLSLASSKATIPALFTHDGYAFGFRVLLPGIAKAVASEAWILDDDAKSGDVDALKTLEEDTTNLYLSDFKTQWKAFFQNLTPADFRGVQDEGRVLATLGGDESPYKKIVVSAAQQTNLTVEAGALPKTPGFSSLVQKFAGPAFQAAQGLIQKNAGKSDASKQAQDALGSFINGKVLVAPEVAAEKMASSFKWLQELGADDGAKLGPVMKDMVQAGSEMSNYEGPAAGGEGAPGSAAMSNLQTHVLGNIAPDAQPFFDRFLGRHKQISNQAESTQLNTQVSPLASDCAKKLNGKFPVSSTASDEVAPGDFAQMFGKGGTIDSYVATNLATFVDQANWKWLPSHPGDAGKLVPFKRAELIRKAMFGGGSEPKVAFTLVLVKLENAERATIELDNHDTSKTKFSHAGDSAQLSWPEGMKTGVSVSFKPADNSPAIEKQGYWSWFRLLRDNGLHPGAGANHYEVTFRSGNRSATFEIQADSSDNPFKSNPLEGYRCPAQL